MNKNKAFTLIEVLIVTSVIALLSSIVVNSVSEARTEAEDKNKTEEARQVNNAIGTYRASGNSAPVDAGMSPYVAYNEKSPKYQSAMQKLVDDNSMPEVPKSPNGKDYFYLTDDSGNGVFGTILRSDSEISSNNGCYFTDSRYGCSGDNASFEIEYDRD
ncbi:MAG: type II secretion system protein, partial [Bacteriovoracia bacterium]